MSTLGASDLNTRVTIQQIGTQKDNRGGIVAAATNTDVYAKVENRSGNMGVDLQRRFQYSYKITMRHNTKCHVGVLLKILATNVTVEVKSVEVQEVARKRFLLCYGDAVQRVVNSF